MGKLEEIFDCYDIQRIKVFRGRKMLMCEDAYGQCYGVSELKLSEKRLLREYLAKEYLINNGYTFVDQLLRNKDNSFITEDKYHSAYVVRHFYMGKELNINSVKEVEEGAKNLAILHNKGIGMAEWMREKEKECELDNDKANAEEQKDEDGEKWTILKEMDAEAVQTKNEQKRTDFIQEVTLYSWLYDIISKRNRELFRIAAYMRKNSGKGEFVDVYNDCCEHFLEEGNEAMEGLLNIKDELKSGDAVRKREFCHGNYQHHNIMKCRENWVTIGLEHFYFGVQLEDLYDYLRKVLEKNDYNMDFAKAVLCGYGSEHELTLRDYQCLYLLLIYPVKFWKISNRYFNSRKTWIPPKMVEKLQNVVKQDEEKRNFLVKFKEDYVD